MKTTCLVFLLTIAFTYVSRGQSGGMPTAETSVLECVYRFTFQPDSTTKVRGTDIQLLSIGRTLSKFESRSLYLNDSLKAVTPPLTQETAQAYTDALLSLPRVATGYTFYKTPTTGKLYCYDRVGTTRYTFKEPDNLFKWSILPDTARVAGYACQRATAAFAGRQWEAWFTRQIPIAEGPYKFYGLPGLIVKVGDTRQHYVFELVRTSQPKVGRPIALPTDPATLTTKKALRQGKADYQASMLDRVAAMGNNITPAERQAEKERAKKRNNPLELNL